MAFAWIAGAVLSAIVRVLRSDCDFKLMVLPTKECEGSASSQEMIMIAGTKVWVIALEGLIMGRIKRISMHVREVMANISPD